MQYLGGKSRTWEQICFFLEYIREPEQIYFEPFVGGAWVLQGMRGKRIASDANVALITMYKALQNGWTPPSSISEEEYERVKSVKDENDPLTAFAGFGCSFAGKWFGGLASRDDRNYASNAKNSLLDKAVHFNGVEFLSGDYRSYSPIGQIVYCDPPYENTTGYGAIGNFDSVQFWEVMRGWSKTNTVVVSSYVAPTDYSCVKRMFTKTDIRVNGEKEYRTERLFMLSGTERYAPDQMSMF